MRDKQVTFPSRVQRAFLRLVRSVLDFESQAKEPHGP